MCNISRWYININILGNKCLYPIFFKCIKKKNLNVYLESTYNIFSSQKPKKTRKKRNQTPHPPPPKQKNPQKTQQNPQQQQQKNKTNPVILCSGGFSPNLIHTDYEVNTFVT